MMAPASPHRMRLVVDRLAQSRGDHMLFRDLTFAVGAGEILVLTGPNGTGKTTLLRTLAGLLPAATGTVALIGGDVELGVGEQAHVVGHTDAIKGALSVVENAMAWSAILGGPKDVEPALDALALRDLAPIPAQYLSAGQKRRLGLARLLLAPRPLWLLDEPTVSLDAINRDRVAGLIEAHAAGGGIVVVATHLPLGLATARELALTGNSAFGDGV